MSKMIEDLKAAGWVETTLGECWVGEEVLLTKAGHIPRVLRVAQPAERVGEKELFVSASDGYARLDTTPVLRAPRPEYASGTVALIRWRENQLPVRAWRKHERWILPGSMPAVDDDDVEVVRVLLPADQDTPAVEITDEMVERAAEACYYACNEDSTFRSEWGDVCEEHPALADLYQRGARAALEAALEKEK